MNMAAMKDTATFFTEGTPTQFKHVLGLYPQALKLKAERKTRKPEELIKLDNWYQNELPKKIKSRGKDAHLIHEELVQLMKWKQTRGKAYPQLNYLVKVNTPRAVMAETKKAFRKLPNLEQAIMALSNLKGVGTTMASALLAAAAPEKAPFMADECLMAIPDIEGIDYTTKEYMNFVQHIQTVADRLNNDMPNSGWNAHKVELALWTHFVASELSPELLENIPETNGKSAHQNGECVASVNNESDDGENSRGQLSSDAAVASDSADDSRGQPEAPVPADEEASRPDDEDDDVQGSAASDNSQRVEETTNDSADSTDAVGATDDDSSAEPPPSKKPRPQH